MINQIKNKTYALLRRSEKWTKTDMVYLAKGGFWLSASKAVGSLSSFILALAYANWLPVETYATYKYVLSLAMFILIPTLIGMNGSLTRSIALGFDSAFIEVFKIKLKYGVLGFLVGLSMSAYYYLQGNPMLGAGILIISIFIPLIEAFNIFGAYLQGKKLFKEIGLYNAINNIILSAVIVATVYFSKNLNTIILANYSVSLIISIIIFLYVRKKNDFNTKRDEGTVSFGKHLSFITAFSQAAEQVDKILTWHLLGPVSLAVYSFATIPATQIQSFFKLIPTLAFPKIANQDSEQIKKTLPKKIAKFTFIILFIVIAYVLSAPFLFQLFFPKYLDSVIYSQIFSVTLLFYPVRLISHVLIAKAQQKSLYIIQFLNPITKLILVAILLPIFGLYGLIYASIIHLAIGSLYLVYFFYKI